MEIIATGELRPYLKTKLPKFNDPVIYISSNFIPGCPKCNSGATVYYIKLVERESIPKDDSIEKASYHKFPIDIFVKYSIQKGKPKKFIVGTKRSKGEIQMILRKIIY
ncbi:MAG: hypothetical protein EU541_06795 [Promethearchaeota archaeon]|nr:MAG: hypothetical protein EU541_06795 [Candidatus Lokiarchaeota archaeon]